MNRKHRFLDILVPVLVALSALLLLIAVAAPRSVGDTRAAADKMELRLQSRMAKLERYIDRPGAKLPEDMVIYVYTDDTLRSWRGRFPLLNDRISSRLVVQRLVSPRANIDSPLSYVGTDPILLNMGPSWYLVESRNDSGTHIIAGLLISNSLDTRNPGGINRHFHTGQHYTVRTLTSSEGSPVYYMGRPVFKLAYDSGTVAVMANPLLVWLSLALFLAAALLFVFNRRTLLRALIACLGIIAATVAMYFWGKGLQSELSLFSPMVYAGGGFLYSLGAIILVNLTILLCSVCLYLARRDLWASVHSKALKWFLVGLDLVAIVLLAVYTHYTLRSIILNSGITLELYKLGGISWYTLLVYASMISMLASVPLILQLIQPVCTELFGKHINFFSRSARAVYAVLVAVYMVTTTALLGFSKEQNRTGVWASRLAVDRDINLELQLLRVERRIADDAVITTLSGIEGTEAIIRNRIVDNYLLNVSQDCSIGVEIYREENSREFSKRVSTLFTDGTPIADGSAFYCLPTDDGPSNYEGIFRFSLGGPYSFLVLRVEQRSGMGKGYERLLSMTSNGRMTIPRIYSYARYTGSTLKSFRGTYPYSTNMDDWLKLAVYLDGVRHYSRDGYEHFASVVAPDEAVIISRRSSATFSFIMSGLIIALAMYFFLAAFKPWYNRRPRQETTYFRSRISLTLQVSLILSLVVMAAASAVFVYRRNEANQRAIMSERINSIQLQAQNGLKDIDDADVPGSAEFAALIQGVSDNTGSDISVYGTDGRIVLSTNPEVLDHLILGYRIESEALEEIMTLNKRYCILKQGKGLRHYYNMYMPLSDADGRQLAILCSPYVQNGYDFERDAVMHLMSILSVFLLLFILALLAESAVLDKVFQPLSVVRSSMSKAGRGSLEHISYGRTDEISALVDTYNRMVDELKDSSDRLAHAERDKAWSAMARQVAHEIKNPLTPMKLQIQRLIRLKQKGDPTWVEKFDEVSKVLLDHIDILTETSNEFSTFARLYTEEHTEFDFDALLQEEISMFDNREDVKFSYIGLSGAMISGPRPQLTRVIVNLLGNAVQAVEGTPDAQVLVSLRRSTQEGFYDFVVEDNGPGVSEENQERLFTPNFTTKNGGSGLGLAISRSILESCGATIGYSRSFTLGGACFTVTYPCGQPTA